MTLGRVLTPKPAPEQDIASSWLTVEGAALPRIWSSASPSLSPLAPLPCRLTSGGTEHRLPLWVAHVDRPYQGEPADQIIVTALRLWPATLRAARRVQCLDLSGTVAREWEDVGVLDQPAQTPRWLTDALEHKIWKPTPIAGQAPYSWPTPVDTCTVTGDARTLRLEGAMGWGETLINVRHTEDDSMIGVLVQVGIDPELPHAPRGGTRGRPAVKRYWRAEVSLAAELAARPVVDLATGDARSSAERSWRQWRKGHRPPSTEGRDQPPE